jgi:cellulose synthase operon protein C
VSDLDPLLDSLVGDDEWARHEALDRLRTRGAAPDDLERLLVELAGDDPERRAAARTALSVLAAPGCPTAQDATETLLAAMASPDADLRVLAATAVGESGNTAFLHALIDGLNDADPNVIGAAADALAGLDHPAALVPLAALTERAEFWVRAAGVVALGRLRDPAALPALGRAAATPGLEGAVVEAVRAIGDPAGLDVLAVVSPRLPLPALEAAGSILSARSQVDPPAWVREGARASVATLLDRMAGHDDPAVGRLLGLAGTPEAIHALLDMAGPPRRSEAAINGLLALSSEEHADPMLRHLADADADAYDTATLLSLLPPLERPDRIERLVPFLAHDDPAVRAAAAEALARSPAERSLPLLADQLTGANVAPEIVRATGALGATACVALLPLLADPDAAVRTAAADALGRCADASLAEEVQTALSREEDPGARCALLRSLGRLGGGAAVATVAPALGDPDPETRLAAIEALGATGSAEAIPHLQKALDGDAGETLAIIRALGELGQPAAAPIIERWLRSSDLDQRRAAVRAARAVARSVGVAAIRSLAEDADPWIRLSAARLLGEHGEPGRAALERLASEDTDPDVRTEARRQLVRPEP